MVIYYFAQDISLALYMYLLILAKLTIETVFIPWIFHGYHCFHTYTTETNTDIFSISLDLYTTHLRRAQFQGTDHV